MTVDLEGLKALVRDVPDFPKKGIIFKDITPLLKDGGALRFATDQLAEALKELPIDQVVGIESRGFILSPAVAYRLGAGFVPVRKKGKLPAAKEVIAYSLEYGEDTLEIHRDAIQEGTRVVIIDDLLATGGTGEAVVKLVEKLGGTVFALAFLVELAFLRGRERLAPYPVHSLIQYS
ncbi:MAG: adenine phosphoribosyltransferase [Omnitrophica bacterium RIFCSPLOWO2_12_FULL_50_11]|nr:MAG: adenine phosphoribosyltransferase [Omnitrophica bacterium RIFCSPLOWO2_12_FULL_50_11]